MINDRIFAYSFRFTVFNFKKYKYNDNRAGVKTHYIACMLRGSAKIVCDTGECVTISEGDVFYIPKGLKYESFWYGDPNVEFASLGFELFPSFNSEKFSPQTISCDEEDKATIEALAREGKVNSGKIGALYTVLGKLIPKMKNTSFDKKGEFVAKIKRYITSHPKESISSVAKRFAISESGLYSIFKKHSDQSIGECKSRAIMNNALDLLISSDTPVEEISENLGFSSSSYFRKCFKAHFGVSPREMRKKNRI